MSVVIVGVIRRKPVLTHASIVCEGMLASVNSVNSVSVHCREFVHCSDFTVTVLSGGLPENRKTQQDAADPMKNTEYGIMTLNL